MHEEARAKINLFLHVTGRRPDGFHDLESLVVFPAIADVLHAEPADILTCSVSGPFAAALPDKGGSNLVMRAALALQQALGIRKGAALALEKNLPVASGIGGGSADAAAALRLLVRLWGVDVAMPTLEEIAADLGSDVPVCLHQNTARMAGRGERMQPVTLPGSLHLVLVNPGISVSTAEVFHRMPPVYREPVPATDRFASQDRLLAWLSTLHNDLLAPALSLAPQISDVLGFLVSQPGCLMARMSGSGATCFGIFADSAAACDALRVSPQGWWAVQAST